MKTVVFDPAAGPLVAEVASAHAQPGSYRVLLWEAEVNQVVFTVRGNFINPDDDAHTLPGGAAEQHGRLVESLATLVVTPPLDKFKVILRILQDGEELGRETQEGEGVPFGVVTADLFVLLEAGAQPVDG
jgi:hypothetical protein